MADGSSAGAPPDPDASGDDAPSPQLDALVHRGTQFLEREGIEYDRSCVEQFFRACLKQFDRMTEDELVEKFEEKVENGSARLTDETTDTNRSGPNSTSTDIGDAGPQAQVRTKSGGETGAAESDSRRGTTPVDPSSGSAGDRERTVPADGGDEAKSSSSRQVPDFESPSKNGQPASTRGSDQTRATDQEGRTEESDDDIVEAVAEHADDYEPSSEGASGSAPPVEAPRSADSEQTYSPTNVRNLFEHSDGNDTGNGDPVWATLVGEVIEVHPSQDDTWAQIAYMADEETVIRVAVWEKSARENPELRIDGPGSYKLTDVAIDSSSDYIVPTATVNSNSSVVRESVDVDGSPASAIPDEITGTIVDLDPRAGLIHRCGVDGCGRVLDNEGNCSEHDDPEATVDFRAKAVIDTGTECYRTLLQRPALEYLTETSLEDVQEMARDHGSAEYISTWIRHLLLGRYVKARVAHYRGDAQALYIVKAIQQVNDPLALVRKERLESILKSEDVARAIENADFAGTDGPSDPRLSFRDTMDELPSHGELVDDRQPRLPAVRVSLEELNKVTVQSRPGDKDSPTWTLLPTGAKINRVLTMGSLEGITETDDDVRSRLVGGAGTAVTLYAHTEYEQRAATQLGGLEEGTLVAVIGKIHVYATDDGETKVSVRPESVIPVDGPTYVNWALDTAAQTIERITRFVEAAPDPDSGDPESIVEAAAVEYNPDLNEIRDDVGSILAEIAAHN